LGSWQEAGLFLAAEGSVASFACLVPVSTGPKWWKPAVLAVRNQPKVVLRPYPESDIQEIIRVVNPCFASSDAQRKNCMNIFKSVICATLFAQLFLNGAAMAEKIDFANLKTTPEMILEAKSNPNGWVYVIMGNYGPKDSVPPDAIAGAWKVDSSGEIVSDSFQANPKYKPKRDQ
jgi:hypothetical protein